MKVVDPHIDIADMYKLFGYTDTDFFADCDAPVTYSKLRGAGVDIVGFSLYFDKSFVKTSFYDGVMDYYGFYQRILAMSKGKIRLVRSSSEIINKPKKAIGALYSIEGLECFRSIKDFETFYDIGVRLFGFTWDYSNDYACARSAKNDTGLTSLGKVLSRQMSGKKLIVDIAHLSERSVLDVAKYYEGMMVTTHGNARSVCETTHNLTDREIQLVVDRGGVVSVFPLVSDSGPNATFDDLFAHVRYVADKWGLEYVGYSSDIYPLPEYPFIGDHKDVLITKAFHDFLMKKMSACEVEQVMYGNWYRVLSQAL